MDKCKICGQTSHTKDAAHLNKSQIYKIYAKGIELVDRSYFSGEELADVAASYSGELVILIEKRVGPKLGWFSRAPTTMRHEAQPKPAKFVMPNGVVMWRTNHADNRPDDAPEYKIRKAIATIKGDANCPSCGESIPFDDLEEKNIRCKNCGKRYKKTVTDREMVMLWSKAESTDLQVGIKLEAI